MTISDTTLGLSVRETTFKSAFITGSLQAVFIVLTLYIGLNLTGFDLRVPLAYSGDALSQVMFVKGMMLNGWACEIPQLSQPYSFHAAAFPIATSVDWLLMKAISLFTSEVGLVVNLFWMFSVCLTAWIATFSFTCLGINRCLAVTGGVLYCFLPFAILRNLNHLNLVYYLVPLICLLAHYLISGAEEQKNTKVILIAGYVGCLLQGFNYIYYSYFAVIILGYSALAGYMKTRSYVPLKIGATACLIVITATALNLTPTFVTSYYNGKPVEMSYKHQAESEVYGAKLRKMLVPHHNNLIGYLRNWAKKDQKARFPLENENETVRLGHYGAFGLCLIFFTLLGLRKGNGKKEMSLTRISLFIFLVITVGGLATIFNLLLVGPDIRAYNRFSVFLAFYCLAMTSFWVQGRYATITSKRKKGAFAIAVTLFALLSLHDQTSGLARIRHGLSAAKKNANKDRQLVEKLEKFCESGTKIFQLPMTGFPLNLKTHKMEAYDHLRPFIWSSKLNWSWPSFSQRHRKWQDRLAGMADKELLNAVVFSGFQLIWIDCDGYKDNADSIVGSFAESGARELSFPEHDRYRILSLKTATSRLRERLGPEVFARKCNHILNTGQPALQKGIQEEPK